jgi:non-ribosomal peptide synthetase component F
VAAVDVLLGRHSGGTDIVVGTQLGGRYRSEVEGVVGLFAGPALLRTDLSGDPTIETVVGRVRESVQALFENQPFPYLRLRVGLWPEIVATGIPFWQALDAVDVELFHTHPERWSPGIDIVARPPASRFPTNEERSEFSGPLEFALFEDGTRMWSRVTYRCDLFDRTTVEGFADEFEHLLTNAAANWRVRLSDLPRL